MNSNHNQTVFDTPFTRNEISEWMKLAITLAKKGPKVNPNPRVGAVIVNDNGQVIGSGWHAGAGHPHAEVEAINSAKRNRETLDNERYNTKGSTLIVTLEPCNHYGFTGPCTEAIIDAGIKQVVYAASDPGVTSGGGADFLASKNIPPFYCPTRKASRMNQVWENAISRGRPYVTLKLATTLDGYVAAVDGTSKWITGPEAREHAHRFRAQVGAIAVTTGTVLADNPALSARVTREITLGSEVYLKSEFAEQQPLAVVIGQRDIPDDAAVRNAPGGFIQYRTHDVAEVLAALNKRGVRHLLVEGGPALATAFLAADLVDEIHAYIAPSILGEGKPAILPFGITTLSNAEDFVNTKVKKLGRDVFISTRVNPSARNRK